MTPQQQFDPAPELAEVQTATDRFLASISDLDADAIAAPSLLPGWTRGHVCAHVTGNAESLINLLTWARTGIETPAYPPGDGRERAIEAGASRSPSEHVAGVRSSADQFARAVEQLPPDRWDAEVTWRGGAVAPVRGVLWARLRELEIHHVDLGLAYAPAHWDEDLSGHIMANVTGGFRALDPAPAFDLHAVDTDQRWQLGDSRAKVVVSGAQAALLAWLIGRSSGDGLSADDLDGQGTQLPVPPPWL